MGRHRWLGGGSFELQTAFDHWTVELPAVPRPPEDTDLAREFLSDVSFLMDSRGSAAAEFVLGLLSLAVTVVPDDSELTVNPHLLTVLLERELLRGTFGVLRRPRETGTPAERVIPVAPKSPAPPRETNDTFFDVRYVDEAGQPLNGIPIAFSGGGQGREVNTNAGGVALLEHMTSFTAGAVIADVSKLEKVLDTRWTKFRQPSASKASNLFTFPFRAAGIPSVQLKAAVPHTIVVTPPRGLIYMSLRDKTGRVVHANRKYKIVGPQSFEGTTDEKGELRHTDVFPGDYQLSLTLEFFEGKDKKTDVYESPAVVLSSETGTPELRRVGAVPFTVLARLVSFFSNGKAFVLPTAISRFSELRQLCVENRTGKIVVAGHARTSGSAKFNEDLSLDRARSVLAFLRDDVETWLSFFDQGVEKAKRWGAAEERMMLTSMLNFAAKPKGQDTISWFQKTRGLFVDGSLGPDTRRRLVAEYMKLDGAPLEDAGVDLDATLHGCGDHFPLGPAPGDCRVEVFFFDREFGVVPEPSERISKQGTKEYPTWRDDADEVHVLDAAELSGPELTFIELADVLFRTESAVVLPEGEAPSKSGHESLTTVGVIAHALRHIHENPGKRVFVAGHTDTTGDNAYNQVLSEERAKCVLALLIGDRESFKTLCERRHTAGDYQQVLRWASRNFANLDVNSLTWGAIFDCYEIALQQELGEDAAGVASLRAGIVFVDEKRRSLGFSEYFPIDELGVDNYRSQANRRVEILFFEQGKEPDLQHAEEDPETSELYLPANYARIALEPMVSAKAWSATWAQERACGEVSGELVLSAPDAPDGMPVVFLVTCSMTGESAFVPGHCDRGTAGAMFAEFEKLLSTVEPQDFYDSEFPVVEFSFVAQAGERHVESKNSLTYGDEMEVEVRVVLDSGDEADTDELPYRLVTLLGVRSGVSARNEEGMALVKAEGLPPGGATLLIDSIRSAGATNAGHGI